MWPYVLVRVLIERAESENNWWVAVQLDRVYFVFDNGSYTERSHTNRGFYTSQSTVHFTVQLSTVQLMTLLSLLFGAQGPRAQGPGPGSQLAPVSLGKPPGQA